MKSCPACRVIVEDEQDTCPLCGATTQAGPPTQDGNQSSNQAGGPSTGQARSQSPSQVGGPSTGQARGQSANLAGSQSPSQVGGPSTGQARGQSANQSGGQAARQAGNHSPSQTGRQAANEPSDATDAPPSGVSPSRPTDPVTTDPEFESTVRSAKVWLTEMFSLVAFTAALVIFAADFAYGFELTWSRIPLVSIGFVWIIGAFAIVLARLPIILLLAETGVIALYLFVLNRFADPGEWFLPLALPITVLVGVLLGITVAVSAKLKLTAIPILGVAFLATGVFLVGLELVLNNWMGVEEVVSWSLVSFACTLSVFVVLLFINRRFRMRHQEFKKVFHI